MKVTDLTVELSHITQNPLHLISLSFNQLDILVSDVNISDCNQISCHSDSNFTITLIYFCGILSWLFLVLVSIRTQWPFQPSFCFVTFDVFQTSWAVICYTALGRNIKQLFCICVIPYKLNFVSYKYFELFGDILDVTHTTLQSSRNTPSWYKLQVLVATLEQP